MIDTIGLIVSSVLGVSALTLCSFFVLLVDRARGRLYIEANYLDDRLYGDPIYTSDNLDQLKEAAEAHRLDLACRMLGVTE